MYVCMQNINKLRNIYNYKFVKVNGKICINLIVANTNIQVNGYIDNT